MHFIGRFVLCVVSSSVIQSITPIIGLLAVVGVLKITDASKITTEQVYRMQNDTGRNDFRLQ